MILQLFLIALEKREVLIEVARYKQKEFRRYLEKIRIGNKSERNKKKTLVNINKLFNRRKDAFKFVDEYDSMVPEAKRKAAGEEQEGTELTKTKKI